MQPVADAGVDQRVDGVLLEDAGADARLDVLPRAVLQDDGVDALQVQEPREEQTGRTGPDDAYLGAHGPSVTGGRRPEGTATFRSVEVAACGRARGRCRGRPPPAPAPAGGGPGGAAGRRRPSAATTTGPVRRSTWTGTASEAAPGDISSDVRAYRRRRTSASSRRSRPGSTTVLRVIRVRRAQRLLDDLVRRGGEQHLADAGRVQRQPAADLADDRHRLAPGDPLDVERAEPLAHGQVHGVADRRVHVEQEGRGHLAQLAAAPGRAGRGPRACGRSRSGRRCAGRARPSRPARRAAGAPWSAVCPTARRSRRGTAGATSRRTRRGCARAREVTERPGSRAATGHERTPLRLLSSGRPRLGSVRPRPYGPGMTGTTSASGLHLPRYLREDDAARTPVGFPDYRSTGLRAPLRTPVDLPHRLTEVTGPLLGEERVTAAGRRPDPAQRRRAVGPADPRPRPGARQRRPAGAGHPGRGLAGQRGRPLPARRRQLARAARPALRRAGPGRDRRRRPLRVHDDQARRLPVGQPPQRLAAGAHPLLAVRPGVHPAPGHPDVLPGRPAVRPGPDLQRRSRRRPGTARSAGSDRAHRGQLGAGLRVGHRAARHATRPRSRPTTTET